MKTSFHAQQQFIDYPPKNNLVAETETIKRFSERERVASEKLSSSEIEESEKTISLLPVQIQISEKDVNATRIVSVGSTWKYWKYFDMHSLT